MSQSIKLRRPATKPPSEPRALLSVPMRMWTPLSTPNMFRHAAAVLAEHAGGVGFVDHEHGVMLLGQFRQLHQRREIAVHAEERIGDDQPAAVCADCGAVLPDDRHRRGGRCASRLATSRQPSIRLA